MQLGDPVDCMAANGRQVCHADAPVIALIDDRQPRHQRIIAQVADAHLVQKLVSVGFQTVPVGSANHRPPLPHAQGTQRTDAHRNVLENGDGHIFPDVARLKQVPVST